MREKPFTRPTIVAASELPAQATRTHTDITMLVLRLERGRTSQFSRQSWKVFFQSVSGSECSLLPALHHRTRQLTARGCQSLN
jgi:redox-sensitive bicupin YhaK (pirin superfamily)